MGWFFSSSNDDAEAGSGEECAEEYIEEQGSGETGSGETTQEDAGGDSGERSATIVDWAQRLMITKGYGWSKAMDTARDMYGD